MTNVFACPDMNQLSQLLTGKLPEPEKETLLEHLETCEGCANHLGTIASTDSFAELVRQWRRSCTSAGRWPRGWTGRTSAA